MKAKKALKRLDKVEELLSNIIEEFDAAESPLKELLGNARATVAVAKSKINEAVVPRQTKGPSTPKTPSVRTPASSKKS